MKKNFMKKMFSGVLSAAMVASLFSGIGMTADAAGTSTTYSAPTEPMSVSDSNYITATAHRAASPVLGMMGLNATSGFGMIQGSAPASLSDAVKQPALGIWGTSLNDNPDPYYWNYFYNFYADAAGLEKSSDALINDDVQASPVQADTTLKEEYGNVSVSLSTRPDIAIGCASTASGTDTDGYNDQIATINSFTSDSEYYQAGDETYSPKLISYQTTHLTDMIASVKRIAAAMDEVTEETGKEGRYGDPDQIATDYETYVYATNAYVMSKIADGTTTKKTVAVLSDYDEATDTFYLASASTREATSSNRYVEYSDLVAQNIAEGKESTTIGSGRNAKTVTAVTADELAAADVIICSDFDSEGFTDASGEETSLKALLEKEADYNKSQMIITNYPSALYGITMNSVENAMGLGYIVGYMYSDVLDINPVDMCAYYYQKFYHISDLESLKKVVSTNFASVTLPTGMSNQLSDDYDAAKIEAMLGEGTTYYAYNQDAFADTYIGNAGWTVSSQAIVVPSTSITKKVTDKAFSIGAVSDTALTYASSNTKVAKVSADGKVTPVAAGTATITITAPGCMNNAAVEATVKVTIKKAAQTIKLSGTTKTLKYKATKKAAQKFTVKASAKTSVKFAKVSGSKYLKIASNGKVTVKKGTRKGTYKMVVKATAATTSAYNSATVKKTIKVVVK